MDVILSKAPVELSYYGKNLAIQRYNNIAGDTKIALSDYGNAIGWNVKNKIPISHIEANSDKLHGKDVYIIIYRVPSFFSFSPPGDYFEVPHKDKACQNGLYIRDNAVLMVKINGHYFKSYDEPIVTVKFKKSSVNKFWYHTKHIQVCIKKYFR